MAVDGDQPRVDRSRPLKFYNPKLYNAPHIGSNRKEVKVDAKAGPAAASGGGGNDAEITKLGDNSWLVVTKLGDRLRDMDNVQVRRRQSVLHRLVSTPCLAPPVSPPPPLTSFSPFDRVQICSVVCSEMERRW